MMTKNAKRARKGRPAKSGRRHPSGKLVQPTPREKAQDAQEAAITARLRLLSLPDTEANRDAAKSQTAGCEVGRRIMAEKDPSPLWEAVKHWRAAVLAYDRAIGSPLRHTKSLGILTPTEGMSADASTPARDDRPEDVRYRQAVSAHMRIETWLGYTDKQARSAAIIHVIDEVDQPIRDWVGVKSALMCIADGMADRKPMWRGRDLHPQVDTSANLRYR